MAYKGKSKRIYGITLDKAQDKLEMWVEAQDLIAAGQSYTIGSRTLTRADLDNVQSMIEYWSGKVNELLAAEAGAGGRVKRMVYRDV